MSRKIIGVTVGTPLPKPSWKQNDPKKGDYIKDKPEIPTGFMLVNESNGKTLYDISGAAIVDGTVRLSTGKDTKYTFENAYAFSSSRSLVIFDVKENKKYRFTFPKTWPVGSCSVTTEPLVTDGGAADGITPHIGDNGNWWIGDTDTGVNATVDTTEVEGYANAAATAAAAAEASAVRAEEAAERAEAAGGSGGGNVSIYRETIETTEAVGAISVTLPVLAEKLIMFQSVVVIPTDESGTNPATTNFFMYVGKSGLNLPNMPTVGSLCIGGVRYGQHFAIGYGTRPDVYYQNIAPTFSGKGAVQGIATLGGNTVSWNWNSNAIFPAGTKLEFWGLYEL